jgi:hypothetical protein
MKSAITDVSYAASQTLNTETVSFEGDRIELEFEFDGIVRNGLGRCS